MSGVEVISESSNGEQRSEDTSQRQKNVSAAKDTITPANISVRFEEVTELSFDDEIEDPEDETYVPSEWEMTINSPEPEDADDVPYENDINAIIHDIDLDVSDQNVRVEQTPSPGIKKLQDVSPSDEEESMFMISRSSLAFLTDFIPYKQCSRPECGQQLEIKERRIGCGLFLRWICLNGHEAMSWASQPILPNSAMLGNFKFCSAIVLSGNNYRKIALLCKFLRVGIPSKTSFDNLQRNYIVPEVNKYWTTMKQTTQEKLRALDVVAAGDGRMDSPGHSAQYCTYTMMNQADKDIIAMEIVDKRECLLKATLLEATGFKKAMTDLDSAGVTVAEVVTDAHPQISSIMKKDYPDMKHSWDMWHGSKNLGKKLCAAAMEKGNNKLKPWISDIVNHFYYSAENCQGSEMLLQAKMVSVMNHCVNRHNWALGQCDHEPIDSNQEGRKEWLTQSGPEILALEKVIMDPRFMNTLKYYITCQTTSELESFNNHLLMYAAKRQSYSYPVYKCRCQIAAIDYMSHKDRPYKVNKKGDYYYNRYFSKGANQWRFKYVKEQKTYSYISQLMVLILSEYCNFYKEKPLSKKRELEADDPRRLAENVAPGETPATLELVAQRQSRLKSSWPKPGTSKDDETLIESSDKKQI